MGRTRQWKWWKGGEIWVGQEGTEQKNQGLSGMGVGWREQKNECQVPQKWTARHRENQRDFPHTQSLKLSRTQPCVWINGYTQCRPFPNTFELGPALLSPEKRSVKLTKSKLRPEQSWFSAIVPEAASMQCDSAVVIWDRVCVSPLKFFMRLVLHLGSCFFFVYKQEDVSNESVFI